MVESPSVVAAEHGSLRRESSRSVAWRDLNEPDHAERVGPPRARPGLPWAPTLTRSLHFVDELDRQIAECEAELRSRAPTTPTSNCCARSRASAGSSATRSRPRSANIAASARPRSSRGTPGCVPSCANRVAETIAGRSPRTAPSTYAGRSSRPRPTPPGTRRTRSGASGTNGAARRGTAMSLLRPLDRRRAAGGEHEREQEAAGDLPAPNPSRPVKAREGTARRRSR